MTDPHGGHAEQGATAAWSAVPHQAPAPSVEATAPIAPAAAQFQPGSAQVPVPDAQFQPGSAQVPLPVSGAPAGDAYATAAYATAAYGVPAATAPAPPKQRRTGTIVLSIATGVLALATAALGVLYFLEADARAKTDAELTQRTAALAAEEAKAKNLDTQLKASKEEVAKLNQDLTGAKTKTDEVTKARDALIGCFQAIEAFDAKQNADNAKQVIIKCDEADKYL